MYKILYDLTKQYQIIFLISSLIMSILIRYSIAPIDIPLTLDSLQYFLVAKDISNGLNFEEVYSKPNLGWPIFLSFIFNITQMNNILDLMNMQRIVSIIFSSLTIIPLFYLAKKFFDSKIAIVASISFIFSPYIILNSFIGSNDSVFFFLITIFFTLFFSSKKKLMIISFLMLSISSLFRYESVIIIIPALLFLLIKLRDKKFDKISLILVITLSFVPIILMMYYRISLGLSDGFISHFLSASSIINYEQSIIKEPVESRFYLDRGIINFVKFSGLLFLPFSFIFIPFSILSIFKKQKDFIIFVIFGIVSAIPALYAFSRGFLDIKYMFILYPMLMISTLFFVEKLLSKFNSNNKILVVMLVAIIIGSLIIIENKIEDKLYYEESIKVANIISKFDGKINQYGKESYFVEPLTYINKNKIDGSTFSKRYFIVINDEIENLNKLNKLVKDKNLKYLAITENNFKENDIFYNLYTNDNSYDFVNLVYDYTNEFKILKIKIFQIDSNKLEEFLIKN